MTISFLSNVPLHVENTEDVEENVYLDGNAGDVRPFVEVTVEDARKGLHTINIILEFPHYDLFKHFLSSLWSVSSSSEIKV